MAGSQNGIDHRVSLLSQTQATVAVRDLWHRYDGPAGPWTLRGIDLELAAGELVGLLGPSGCGKTTLLRLIAGFERPSQGSVHLQQRPVAGNGHWLPPERRGIGMVFQDYALFPHLTAWQNACFGLRPGQDDSRAAWLLELLGLKGLELRYPHQLSGGQKQRLALARALAPAPKLVLLDEPFSNLDVEVRLRLRSELSSVLQVCGATGLIVTHDPSEALAICDRVAVMRDGELHQCATPRALVDAPASPFVGRFVLQGNLVPLDGPMHCLIGALEGDSPLPGSEPGPDEQLLLVDPALIRLQPDPQGEATVMGREFLGQAWQYRVQQGPCDLRVNAALALDVTRGTRCRLAFQPGAEVILFPQRIRLRANDPYAASGVPALRPMPPA
ncbi:ABC transporter ATP-binding protein [Parasynechococcus marenigrum]|uniref:ABC-type quaternary amine transporter n=1 Tax=Parasynechococcus marenigrum (strain WH8102) TaxID=84588 RepID=Q7U5Z7_PARMW|nr:ABC transporter ATP-binding protein [Parasynechococcus marenigrum]CAE08059.1 ABC transporter, ATP binding component, possibly iron transporter [Parasynechococcus marenigrum WH 8102]